jgi:hypothetical protein
VGRILQALPAKGKLKFQIAAIANAYGILSLVTVDRP